MSSVKNMFGNMIDRKVDKKELIDINKQKTNKKDT